MDIFVSLERLHCRAARIIFNLPNDMHSKVVLKSAKWSFLFYNYKLAMFKLMQKTFHGRIPDILCNNIITKRGLRYSLRASNSILAPRFNTRYMQDSIAYRGALLWNSVAATDKNLVDTHTEDLTKKLKSSNMFKDIFSYDVTSVSTANFRLDEFIYI